MDALSKKLFFEGSDAVVSGGKLSSQALNLNLRRKSPIAAMRAWFAEVAINQHVFVFKRGI